MTKKEIIVRIIVDEERDDWDDEPYFFYNISGFELVSTDIPEERLDGIGESWAQSDRYYEKIQDLVRVLV